MRWKKETAASVIFCIVNGILSMNCLVYHFVKDRALRSEKTSRSETVRLNRTAEAMKNPFIVTGKVNRIFFPFEDGGVLCVDLEKKTEVYLVESTYGLCRVNKNAETVETEVIHFPRSPFPSLHLTDEKLKILYSPDSDGNFLMEIIQGSKVSYIEWRLDRSNALKKISESDFKKKLKVSNLYQVILLMDDRYGGFYGIVPKKPVLNYSSLIMASHLAKESVEPISFWRVLYPPALLTDVITFPIQFIGVWLYLIIFGLKK